MPWTILSPEWSQRSAERRHRQVLKKSFWYHLRHIVPWFLDMTSILHITLAQVSSVTQLWSWETRPRWPNQCPDSLSLSYWQARVLIPSSIQVLNYFKSKLNIGNGLGYLNTLCGQSLSHFCHIVYLLTKSFQCRFLGNASCACMPCLRLLLTLLWTCWNSIWAW